jgi:hypothetical protein
VLFFIELASRRMHLAGCTANPTSLCVTQQARQMTWALAERRAVSTNIQHFPARVVVTPARTLPIVLEELSGVRKRPITMSMPTSAGPPQRYDHLWLAKT